MAALFTKSGRPFGRNAYPNSSLLVRNRLLALQRAHYRCPCGKPTRYVHHLNNKKSDHRIENLKPLCSKCHVQTHLAQYPRRPRGRYERWKERYGIGFREIAQRYHVAITTVQFWKERYGWTPDQPRPTTKYSRKGIAPVLPFVIFISFLTFVPSLHAAPRRGVASWFSTEACRTNPDPHCPTASGRSLYELERRRVSFIASWDYPLGAKVQVCQPPTPFNLKRRCTTATVLDRGPALELVAQGRIADLSKTVWWAISDPWAMVNLGTIPVEITELRK